MLACTFVHTCAHMGKHTRPYLREVACELRRGPAHIPWGDHELRDGGQHLHVQRRLCGVAAAS